MRFGSGCCRLAVIGVEQDLPLQQDTGDPKQPIDEEFPDIDDPVPEPERVL